jgi:hypothetical protein
VCVFVKERGREKQKETVFFPKTLSLSFFVCYSFCISLCLSLSLPLPLSPISPKGVVTQWKRFRTRRPSTAKGDLVSPMASASCLAARLISPRTKRAERGQGKKESEKKGKKGKKRKFVESSTQTESLSSSSLSLSLSLSSSLSQTRHPIPLTLTLLMTTIDLSSPLAISSVSLIPISQFSTFRSREIGLLRERPPPRERGLVPIHTYRQSRACSPLFTAINQSICNRSTRM